jgi:putative holliday junction resolvase
MPRRELKHAMLPMGQIADSCWIGIDPGRVRTGMAAADLSGTLASPLGAVGTEPRDTFNERAGMLLGSRQPRGFVVGLPLTERGQEGEAATLAREIGALLAQRWQVDIVYVDERYSSRAAEQSTAQVRAKTSKQFGKAQRMALKQSGALDALAAVEILQSFLDRRTREG